jgi:hypothetical protein
LAASLAELREEMHNPPDHADGSFHVGTNPERRASEQPNLEQTFEKASSWHLHGVYWVLYSFLLARAAG